MTDGVRIPDDMIDRDLSRAMGGTVVSIRDMMIALGASDEVLRDIDEQNDILAREPWRRDGVKFVVRGTLPNGMQWGCMTGEVDWTGTRFAKESTTT